MWEQAYRVFQDRSGRRLDNIQVGDVAGTWGGAVEIARNGWSDRISEDGGVCVKDSHSVLGPAALATRWPLQGPLLSPPSCDYFLCSSSTS